MPPLLVLQFMADDGPGYLAAWAERRGVALDVRSAAAAQAFPAGMEGHRALAVLGGAMSANDDLPFLRDAERLILDAMRKGLPVLGHCLGGQLMARALGARVKASPAPEIGWHRMDVLDLPASRQWFGAVEAPHVFHWHFDAFDLPSGATRLAGSIACPNQAFAIGPHLAMQFHVEIDERKIDDWLSAAGATYAQAQAAHVTAQGPERIRELTPVWLQAQHQLADAIYAHWLGGR
jgi:GMP synthase-like glutamine amidotransferase